MVKTRFELIASAAQIALNALDAGDFKYARELVDAIERAARHGAQTWNVIDFKPREQRWIS